MARGSLRDEAGLDSIGRTRKAPGHRAPGKQTVKLVVALALLLGAGLVLIWSYEIGPFGAPGPSARPLTDEERLNLTNQELERQRRKGEPGMTDAGA